jgi:hypothetical protein
VLGIGGCLQKAQHSTERLHKTDAPRWGILTVEVLAINMVMAGCKPEYGPAVKAAVCWR